ncbi:MAG: HupE/UreJ family protein [Pseudomonadales bacterium]
MQRALSKSPTAKPVRALRIARLMVPAAWILAFCLAPSALQAHEIPSTVRIVAFVKPEGPRVQLLVRAPLGAMRDLSLPQWGPGYLDVAAAEPQLRDAANLWIGNEVTLYADGIRLAAPRLAAVRVSLPSDQSFATFGQALAHVRGAPLDPGVELYWEQGLIDALFEYQLPGGRAAGRDAAHTPALEIDARWARLGVTTTTILRYLPGAGAPERVYEYVGDPGRVPLDPRWHQAFLRFVTLGFDHVLSGWDHLLFVVCLVIPFRRFRPLVMLVTAFTVAHSLTLAAAALGMAPSALWFPPLIETLIAASILYMALENVLGVRLERRWLLAFGFGLVHGFGFAFVLSDSLQFAGSHLAASLLAFNVGIELGQLAVLAVVVPLLAWLFRMLRSERAGVIVLSALVAHTAWHWLVERAGVLADYRFTLPSLDAAWWAGAMRWLMLVLIVVGLLWLLNALYRRWAGADERRAGL